MGEMGRTRYDHISVYVCMKFLRIENEKTRELNYRITQKNPEDSLQCNLPSDLPCE